MEDSPATGAGEHPDNQLPGRNPMNELLFFFFAALALVAAINVLVQKHLLYSPLSLIVMLTKTNLCSQ